MFVFLNKKEQTKRKGNKAAQIRTWDNNVSTLNNFIQLKTEQPYDCSVFSMYYDGKKRREVILLFYVKIFFQLDIVASNLTIWVFANILTSVCSIFIFEPATFFRFNEKKDTYFMLKKPNFVFIMF